MENNKARDRMMIWWVLKQALQPAGSRAQDAIKRLDCDYAAEGPDGFWT